MRTRFTAAPGVSLRGIGLQTGFTRGIEIDNPSGSWLYLPNVETFIPPYTIGWSLVFPYDVASLDVVAGQSPAGQVSTTQGDSVTVYLTNDIDMKPPSSGETSSQFIQQFTPVLSASIQSGVTVTGISVTIITGVAGKRIRLITLSADRVLTGGFGATMPDSGCVFAAGASGGGNLPIRGHLTAMNPTLFFVYPLGLDILLGANLVANVAGDFADTRIAFGASYQII